MRRGSGAGHRSSESDLLLKRSKRNGVFPAKRDQCAAGGELYALIALGYSMVYSVLMLFNFAHGDIFMSGAYIGFFISSGLVSLAVAGWLPIPPWLILALTIVLAMLATSLLGIIIERVGYRPLRNAPRASAAITGLMIGIILETGNLKLFGAARRNFPTLIETRSYQLGGVIITNTRIIIVVVSVVLMLALHLGRAPHQVGNGHARHGLRLRRRAIDGNIR